MIPSDAHAARRIRSGRLGRLLAGAALLAAPMLSSCARPAHLARLASSPAAATVRTIQSTVGPGYSLTTETLVQPVDHRDLGKGNFDQQVLILRPDGASDKAPVLFMLGNETDSTPQRLVALYRNYGSPKDVVFITADHRGYGQSISSENQSRPAYVTINQALADYDRLVRHYKPRFGGKWIGAGCSYGGALVINFAHDHPEHFSAIIASSAPTRFEFLTPEYAAQAAINLGPDLTARLRFHMENLKPDRLHDDKWVDRERVLALVTGLSQLGELQPLKPKIAQFAALPTAEFLARLQRELPAALVDRLDDFAVRRLPQTMLSPEAVRAGNYNWYTWKYQQCNETGTFFTGGLFPHKRKDHVADCRASFGRNPHDLSAHPWPVARMLGELTVPAVIVSGGRDPWMKVGVAPGHRYQNIEYVYFEDGLHCPDVYGAEAGAVVFEKARKVDLLN